jgi:putative membrane protein insertion efficiency factor
MSFRAVLLAPIRLYQRIVSPLLAPRCRYYPTCSHYAEQAVREYGAMRGGVLACWRLLRCNPLSDGGFDYVEDQRLFKSATPRSHGHECGHDHEHDKAGVAG